jgi:transcriptional regulator GlxA family with amidase domain
MSYEPPLLQDEGELGDVLRRLLRKPRQKTRRLEDCRIRNLASYIEHHIAGEWSLADACRELKLDISAAYAARLFKRYTGLGVREYAAKMRLQMAADRLTTTDLPIKVIAAECGYRNHCDLDRRFRERYHLSPTRFREKTA